MTTGSTHPVLHPNLPSPPLSPEQTAQARAALVGTISNLLDTELQGRASLLHANAKALEKQEKDVAKVCLNFPNFLYYTTYKAIVHFPLRRLHN
jgi:hypothetical protein